MLSRSRPRAWANGADDDGWGASRLGAHLLRLQALDAGLGLLLPHQDERPPILIKDERHPEGGGQNVVQRGQTNINAVVPPRQRKTVKANNPPRQSRLREPPRALRRTPLRPKGCPPADPSDPVEGAGRARCRRELGKPRAAVPSSPSLWNSRQARPATAPRWLRARRGAAKQCATPGTFAHLPRPLVPLAASAGRPELRQGRFDPPSPSSAKRMGGHARRPAGGRRGARAHATTAALCGKGWHWAVARALPSSRRRAAAKRPNRHGPAACACSRGRRKRSPGSHRRGAGQQCS